MTAPGQQWLRDASLIVFKGDEPTKGIDLSQLKFRFQTMQFDEESPNTCAIRVYNLSEPTSNRIRTEYARVALRAGYKNGNTGAIFIGSIRQFGIGRESVNEKYLDILAADGDIAYAFGFVNGTLDPGATPKEILARAAGTSTEPLAVAPDLPIVLNGSELPRSKVLFGMMNDYVRDVATSLSATWSIQNGQIVMIPLDGYLPGQAVEVNVGTGMIGVPELTEQGVKVRTLLNPNFRVGGLIKLNNKDINKVIQQTPTDLRRFNSWFDVQHLASISADGLYRLYVVEHVGDTRGQEWYSDMVALAVNNKRVAPFGLATERNF